MRVKGVIFVLIIAALFFGASFISLDSYVESQIEYQASVANGAMVEVDGLEISLAELKIRWDRLQVTDPENTWQNSFETGEAELDFLFWPTLWESVIIEDVVLKDFKFETERETDGYFEIPEPDEGDGEPKEPGFIEEAFGEISAEAKENAQAEFFDIKDDINTDSLLAAVDLKAPDRIDSLRNGLSQNYEKWDSTFATINIDDETARIQETLNGIDTKNLKKVEEALTAIKKVDLLTKQVDSLKTRAQTIQSDFQQDFGSSRFSTSQIDEWIRDDFDRAAKMAKLPTIDAQNIAQSLFGEELFSDYAGYLKYVAMAREYGSRFTGGDDEEKIERYEGRDYKFSDKYDWPRLWIQNIDLSGETKSALQLAGQITDISTDQDKTEKPILFDLSGSDESNRSMKLAGQFNYLEELPKEDISFQYAGFDLSGTKLSPSELLPYPLQQGVGEVNASLSIIDKRIESEIQYLNKDLAFDFGEGRPENRVKQLIQDAVEGTEQIDITALVDNVDGPLDVRIRSNIDNLFVDALRGSISKQVEDARNKIESEVQSRIGNKKEELLAFKDEKEAELRSQYDQLEAKVNEQLQIVEKKKQELEKRKKEIEDELKNRATDAIRSRIGF